jgi:hypothetical protein
MCFNPDLDPQALGIMDKHGWQSDRAALGLGRSIAAKFSTFQNQPG